MKQLNKTDREYLLKLSRTALEHIFKTGKHYLIDKDKVPEALQRPGASFVTLTKNGTLRGCIGRLEAAGELYLDVIANTYAAAFDDFRFPQLKESELPTIKIEISVLSPSSPLKYNSSDDLVAKLAKDKPGVVLQSGYNSATFLPQVWEDLPRPEIFLSDLCLKAGLESDQWRSGKLEIFTYLVEHFQED